MNIKRFKEILKEEVLATITEASITKRFQKAVEALQTIQLKQQELRKKFVAEKDPKKKEKFKQSLISLHKKVQQAEKDFNNAVTSEPIDDLTEKSQGLWANIHAKRKRGEKPAKKGSKAHKKAVKAARSINKEGKLTEALARGLKPLLTLGSKVSWKTMSEDALLDLSDKFDRIDDEVAEDVASYLNIAIENKQDGKQGLATKALKAFNKACKDALAGKAVKSVFEGKLTEATSLWKHFDAKMKLQDEIMDLEYDMKMITKDIGQLHKDMEQEAEPEGGKVADKYGKQIDKKEKEYKKKKSEFKKLMAKLDKMEQY
jgi:hypothetical protein